MYEEFFAIWLVTVFLSPLTFAALDQEEPRDPEDPRYPEDPIPPPNKTIDGPILDIIQRDCCYGDEWYKSGTLVRSFPEKCLSLFCRDGKIHPVYPYEDECNCCEYNGKMYKSGEIISGICIKMKCEKGQWQVKYQYNEKCGKCHVNDDVHMKTFDGVYYDMHGTCKYSITQQGFSQTPPFGIYGDFRPCNGQRSCLDITTFVDNPNTVIEFNYPQINEIYVNGIPYTVPFSIQTVKAGQTPTPVLGWRQGNCIYLLGSQGYYIEYCESSQTYSRMSIWAAPNLVNDINGLCGHFDYSTVDDLLWRDELTATLNPTSAYTNLINYGNRWLTDDQVDRECIGDLEEEDPKPVDCEDSVLDKVIAKCLLLIGDKLTWQEAINEAEFCASDFCALEQIGAPDVDKEVYRAFFVEIVYNLKFIYDHTGPIDDDDDDNGCDDENGDHDDNGVSCGCKGRKLKVKSKHESQMEIVFN